jgi:hypothetical protein
MGLLKFFGGQATASLTPAADVPNEVSALTNAFRRRLSPARLRVYRVKRKQAKKVAYASKRFNRLHR